MPVFLSDNELNYCNGIQHEFSEAYKAKLRQSIRQKLKVLQIDLYAVSKVGEFGVELETLSGYMGEAELIE